MLTLKFDQKIFKEGLIDAMLIGLPLLIILSFLEQTGESDSLSTIGKALFILGIWVIPYLISKARKGKTKNNFVISSIGYFLGVTILSCVYWVIIS